jgi:murein DD-endopeptidase MepM/ murein hydrolase activator NlpD
MFFSLVACVKVNVRPLFRVGFFLLGLAVASTCNLLRAEVFILPTPNQAIFKSGGEAEYFVPTPGKTWVSGTFGCVRTDGRQMHEGLDIKCTQRDKRGEPTDPVYAAAAGRVAYMNENTGLSNYGRYIVLEHQIEGLQVYTLYAHLNRFAEGLKEGDRVKQGETIAIMGRTSNTRSGISKERAHTHFEIDLRLNDRFTAWHKARLPGQRNDHGNWNGRNFAGIDPRQVLLEQRRLGSKFSLLKFIQSRTELCRVEVKDTKFQYVRDYAPLIKRNPTAEKAGVAGYEIALDFNGVPIELIPRSAKELEGSAKVRLISVNISEQKENPCRRLVSPRGKGWVLTNNGSQLIDLLTY